MSAKVLHTTVYTEYNDMSYRVTNICFTGENKNPLCTFKKQGEDVTYQSYYREAYGAPPPRQ